MKLFLTLVLSFLFANTQASEILVSDFLGRNVALKSPAKRVIALAPHIVENIYSVGAGDRIVGTVDYSDYPEAAKNIPRVGAVTTFGLEAIIALKPDLVITWHTGKGANILPKLEQLNIPVYASAPHTLKDVTKTLTDFGKIFNTNEIARKEVYKFNNKLAKIRSEYSNKETVKTFYQVWSDPLQTLNGTHVISDVITLCGGFNIFSDAPMIAPKVSVEGVIAKNPNVIVASGSGEGRPEWLDNWKEWRMLYAVKNNHLYYIPPDIIQRHTVRILDGTQMMCEHIDKARD